MAAILKSFSQKTSGLSGKPGLPDGVPSGLTAQDLWRLYEQMVMIRVFDERALKLQRSGRIGFYVTATGEEATQIGSAAALQTTDWVFPAYRQHGIPLWRGASLVDLSHQLYGNSADRVKGRQMPCHYSFSEIRFVSVSSVIGTQISQAMGAGLAAKLRKESHLSVAYFGDGATSANDFHAGLNFAAVYKAPVLFCCVNNQYAISLPVHQQTASQTIAEKAKAYGMNGVRVDGNDVLAVYAATREAAERARAGQGPTLLEFFTYRIDPHSSSDDPSRYRSQEERQYWLDRDPIAILQRQLLDWKLFSQEELDECWENCRQQVQEATAEAEKVAPPVLETLFDDVYAELPPSLQAQKEELMQYEAHLNLKHAGEFPL